MKIELAEFGRAYEPVDVFVSSDDRIVICGDGEAIIIIAPIDAVILADKLKNAALEYHAQLSSVVQGVE